MGRPLQLNCSSAVERVYPNLRVVLLSTLHAAHDLDSDVPLEDVCVDVKMSRCHDSWSGHAWPEIRSYSRGFESYAFRGIGEKRVHSRGRITMSFGTGLEQTALIRLFAHELRHLAQFHRGYRQTGQMRIVGMTPREYERDCRTFEGLVIEQLGLDPDDGYAHRNEGRLYEPAPATTSKPRPRRPVKR